MLSVFSTKETYVIPVDRMSYASWLICCAARPGQRVTLKIRFDDLKGLEFIQ
jgi:hypothetical protein